MTVTIYSQSGKPVSTSRNLRGILVYCRTHRVESVHIGLPATLYVTWANGAHVVTDFADHSVLMDWVRARKHFAQACMLSEPPQIQSPTPHGSA